MSSPKCNQLCLPELRARESKCFKSKRELAQEDPLILNCAIPSHLYPSSKSCCISGASFQFLLCLQLSPLLPSRNHQSVLGMHHTLVPCFWDFSRTTVNQHLLRAYYILSTILNLFMYSCDFHKCYCLQFIDENTQAKNSLANFQLVSRKAEIQIQVYLIQILPIQPLAFYCLLQISTNNFF